MLLIFSQFFAQVSRQKVGLKSFGKKKLVTIFNQKRGVDIAALPIDIERALQCLDIAKLFFANFYEKAKKKMVF